jgi:hypothetical protein
MKQFPIDLVLDYFDYCNSASHEMLLYFEARSSITVFTREAHWTLLNLLGCILTVSFALLLCGLSHVRVYLSTAYYTF